MHLFPNQRDLHSVHVAQHVDEYDNKGQPDPPRVSRVIGQATEQTNRTKQDADSVEDVVEPAADDRAVALKSRNLAVHTIDDEADVEEDRTEDQRPGSTDPKQGRRA